MFAFGGVGGDANMFRVGYAYEQVAKVRESLHMYLVPETEIGDAVG
jgi:hypothetical protein